MSENAVRAPVAGHPREHFVISACLLATAGSALLVMLARCRAGLDLTDEGFYLNWLYTPAAYDISGSFFGYFYHPLSYLLGHDVVWLRRANILLTVLTALALAGAIFGKTVVTNLHGFAAAVALSVSSCLILQFWLPTPNYNGLTLQGLVVVGLGLALLVGRGAGWWAAIIVGVGGWMVAMAKPPSAILAGILAFIVIVLGCKGRRLSALAIAAMTAGALGILTVVLIDGSATLFVARLQRSSEIQSILVPQLDIWRWDPFIVGDRDRMAFYVAFALAAALTALCRWTHPAVSVARSLVAVLLAATATIGILDGAVTPYHQDAKQAFDPPTYQALAVVGACFGSIVGALTLGRPTSADRAPVAGRIALVVFLLLLPLVFSFGTANNRWTQSLLSIFFWVVAAGFTLKQTVAEAALPRVLGGFGIVTLAATLVILGGVMEHPYRQSEPLRRQAVAAATGPGGTELRLTASMASYVAQLREAAARAENRPRQLIDATGRNPAVVFVLGATATAAPWILAGYPGSDRYFDLVMGRTDCAQVAGAWVLWSPDATARHTAAALARHGLHLDTDFEQLLRVTSPVTGDTHLLLRPTRPLDVATQACESARHRP